MEPDNPGSLGGCYSIVWVGLKTHLGVPESVIFHSGAKESMAQLGLSDLLRLH